MATRETTLSPVSPADDTEALLAVEGLPNHGRKGAFSPDVLKIHPAEMAAAAESAIREIVFKRLKRKGVIVAISGGVDSSVVAALCCRALGPERVLGLMLPEADSSPASTSLAELLAGALGIRTELEDITPILTATGCYRRRDEAIRKVIPEYGPGFKSKIVLPSLMDRTAYALYSIVVQYPDGTIKKTRLSYDAYLGIVAASNFKQRTRKMMEYYYADRHCYAVAGTPNRLEYDQGFFVKNGDGSADLKPIAHLYKTQVYELAAYLGLPAEIQQRAPTTDTYTLEQTQEEFYFVLPLKLMDLCLYALNAGIPAREAAPVVNLTVDQVERVYEIITAKRANARYLHAPPQLIVPI